MTSQLTSLTHFLHELTPRNQRVAIAAVLGAALGIPVFRIAARDYHGYLALGPGGLPHNVVGWLGQMLLKPLRKEPFGTSCYDETAFEKAGPNGHVAFLSEKDVPVRQAPRPVLGSWAVPSRQVSDLADESIIEVCISPGLYLFNLSFNDYSVIKNSSDLSLQNPPPSSRSPHPSPSDEAQLFLQPRTENFTPSPSAQRERSGICTQATAQSMLI
jgi:hypothetical protein